LEKQNSEVFDATAELLNKIAGPEVVETGAKRFRSAAQLALEAKKEARKAATQKLYTDALEQGADVDLTGVKGLINESLDAAPKGGQIEKTFSKIKGFVSDSIIKQGGKEIAVKPSLKQLQKAKFELDNMLESFGENALGKTTKYDVLQLKKALVGAMEEASPTYKAANEEFARLSPAVTELEDSIVGAMSKYKDKDLQNISSRIFSANSNPFVVKKAKAVIEAADPGAWDDMMRVELQRRIGGLDEFLKDASPEVAGNVPGALRRAIFGSASNLEKRRTLMAGLSPEQRKNFTYLDEVLRRASSGRGEGSPTGAFTRIMDKMKFKATGLISSGLSPAKAAKTVVNKQHRVYPYKIILAHLVKLAKLSIPQCCGE